MNLVVLISFLVIAGCASPTIELKPFNQLQRIDEFANGKATNRCVALEIESGHQARVCAFGTLRDGQELLDLFPFLANKESHRGADAMHGRIPKQLLDASKLTAPFRESDRYWLTDVVSKADGKLISVRVALSAKSRRFYVEYDWAL